MTPAFRIGASAILIKGDQLPWLSSTERIAIVPGGTSTASTGGKADSGGGRMTTVAAKAAARAARRKDTRKDLIGRAGIPRPAAANSAAAFAVRWMSSAAPREARTVSRAASARVAGRAPRAAHQAEGLVTPGRKDSVQATLGTLLRVDSGKRGTAKRGMARADTPKAVRAAMVPVLRASTARSVMVKATNGATATNKAAMASAVAAIPVLARDGGTGMAVEGDTARAAQAGGTRRREATLLRAGCRRPAAKRDGVRRATSVRTSE